MTSTSRPGYALVTGASAGIGADLARVLAERGIPLILTARRLDRLEALAEEIRTAYQVDVRVAAHDLGEPGAGDALADHLDALGLHVEILVNNAGFGQIGDYLTLDEAEERSMVRLNMEALTTLTRRMLPRMAEARQGWVLNVASIAAFVPGPLMTVYYASKAYVLSYSEALREELRGTGIVVSCLCPGPVRTEFQERAGMRRIGASDLGVLESEAVARSGIDGLFADRAVVIPGAVNRLAVLLSRFLPRSVLPKLVKSIQAARSPEGAG